MKKIILLSCFFVALGATTYAQLPKLGFGIKGGLNIAKLKNDFADQQNRLGYNAGFWARVSTPAFFVQPELYLGTKGSEFENEISADRIAKGEVKFTTLDVPVLIGKRFGPDLLGVRVMAGPVISFMLSNDADFDTAYEDVKNISDYKNQAWGGQIGAGVDIASFSADLRYEVGFSNVSKSSKYDQKQNLWIVSLAYRIF